MKTPASWNDTSLIFRSVLYNPQVVLWKSFIKSCWNILKGFNDFIDTIHKWNVICTPHLVLSFYLCTDISRWCTAGQSRRGTCKCNFQRCWCTSGSEDKQRDLWRTHPHLQTKRRIRHLLLLLHKLLWFIDPVGFKSQ